jgi:hypothetical protein
VKTDSPDSADFATTRHLICRLWLFVQWLGRPLAYRAVPSAICQRLAQGALPDMSQPADFGRFFSVLSGICQRSPKPLHKVPRIANGLDAQSWQNPLDPKTCLTSMGALLYGPVALKRLIFKQTKKGFANISLGLNYCSMGSSWPRSRDTVPLTPVSGTEVDIGFNLCIRVRVANLFKGQLIPNPINVS